MWHGRFKHDTAESVKNFTQSLDIDFRMAECDILGSIAHVKMLGQTGILKPEESAKIESGLNQVLQEIKSGAFIPSKDLEDVHMNIESRLTEIEPLGAKLHTARSRNDQVAVTTRLYLRERLQEIKKDLRDLLKIFIDNAERHKFIIIPGYTHMQQAQPISMGHYWLAWYEAFMRDYERLNFALDSLNECPLGAGALAGSTLPIDREFTAKFLGFSCPTRNSLDSVANRDYMLDYHYFASVLMIHISRLCSDLITWNTQEFAFIILPDEFCTGSSMMPQKKNPDVLELSRGKTGQVIGGLIDLLVNLKGLPMTYNRDLQEDKRGLWNSLDTIESVINIMSDLLSRVEVDGKISLSRLENGYSLATDIAEYLVNKGVPFREAHLKAGRLVGWCIDNNLLFTDLDLTQWQKLIPEVDADIMEILTPYDSVRRRNIYGATSFEQVDLQIKSARGKLNI
ncbi:MAG: argininosuccinate lyase [Synergistaceae bacterium]|nr:argininosuccinate lyase [Synergistaceae bacterium]